jgi:hypothetical protein
MIKVIQYALNSTHANKEFLPNIDSLLCFEFNSSKQRIFTKYRFHPTKNCMSELYIIYSYKDEEVLNLMELHLIVICASIELLHEKSLRELRMMKSLMVILKYTTQKRELSRANDHQSASHYNGVEIFDNSTQPREFPGVGHDQSKSRYKGVKTVDNSTRPREFLCLRRCSGDKRCCYINKNSNKIIVFGQGNCRVLINISPSRSRVTEELFLRITVNGELRST